MELDLVVGALLRDITQARFLSDVHSRDLSRYYETDSLLRRFPVPRADIEQVELDLRFSVGEVQVEPGGGQGLEASIATVVARHATALAQRVFEELLGATSAPAGRPPEAGEAKAREELAQQLRRETYRIDLQQVLLRFLERNQARLLRDGKLDRSAAADGIREQVLRFLAELPGRAQLSEEAARLVAEWLQEGKLSFLDDPIGRLAGDAQAAMAGRGDVRVQVEIRAGVLRDMPEPAISTLRIKSVVRNYRWSEIEGEGGRVWRKLAPE